MVLINVWVNESILVNSHICTQEWCRFIISRRTLPWTLTYLPFPRTKSNRKTTKLKTSLTKATRETIQNYCWRRLPLKVSLRTPHDMKHSQYCTQRYFLSCARRAEPNGIIGKNKYSFITALFSFEFGMSLKFACWSSNNSTLQGASGGHLY